MAFRIHDSVVRGEIDNRVKGIVRGKIWVKGRPEPLLIELQGNAWPDLAGCLLTFHNPEKRIAHPSFRFFVPRTKRQHRRSDRLTEGARLRRFSRGSHRDESQPEEAAGAHGQ